MRVLVIGGQVISGYSRVAVPGSVVNNVEAGGSRTAGYGTSAGELAVLGASTLEVVVAGVDLAPGPWRVFEVSSSPGIPPNAVGSAAAALAALLRSR